MTAHTATAPASTAILTAAHPTRTVILSASRSAGKVTLGVQTAGARFVVTMPAAQASPDGVTCYFPTCGWEFSHAQTVALFAGSEAAVLAVCNQLLDPVGLAYVCDGIATWIGAHLAPKSKQCLYVSILPVGVIKYVTC
jgi:hypothetical protein